MSKKYNYIIIGSGIIGLAIALSIRDRHLGAKILIIDKEEKEATHASGRNSGVLHSGFYYSSDSLKAKLTAQGNAALKQYCSRKGLVINECGKLVVAQNEAEIQTLYELEKRGKANGSKVEVIDADEALKIEPNVKTFKKALFSPDTASIDPHQVCTAIKNDLLSDGVKFSFSTKYIGHNRNNTIETNKGEFSGQKIINCGGLYADKIANDFGFGYQYTIIPFKGLYLKYTKNNTDVGVNIYPVPNLHNPFLGVHFTKTVTGEIKIGPTAIPAFWRENYSHLQNFNWQEFRQISWQETKLFAKNAFGFRNLAMEEIRKYNKNYFIRLAQKMVQSIDPKGFTEYTKPGIRAQLLDIKSSKLIQDFVIEGDQNSTHILNAVSPAFTCAFPFAEHVVTHHIMAV